MFQYPSHVRNTHTCPHTDLVLVVEVGLTGEELLHHLTATLVGSNHQWSEATLHTGNRIADIIYLHVNQT